MNLNIGQMEHGTRNAITDVPGVRVGHCTVDDARHKTGVTVILPCGDDIFQQKMVAACHVLNGFGKTAGLMQIGELGTLETPIALTNTLNVGLVHDAMVEYMCRQAEAGGYDIPRSIRWSANATTPPSTTSAAGRWDSGRFSRPLKARRRILPWAMWVQARA